MEKITSEFERILPEDTKQFKDLFKRYRDKKLEDLTELYYISTNALILSQRWCEIQSIATTIAKENDCSKTDFQTWAYQHYRNLQEMHIDCRSLYKCGREDIRNFKELE